MLLLTGRGSDSGGFLAAVAGTRAQFLARLTSTRRLPVLRHLPDGSFLSVTGGVKVRVITAKVTVTCHDGTSYGGTYRLATTLPDHRAYPAQALMALYHERREHEVTCLALRHTLLQGRVLRSGDPAGVQQEMRALLAVYQALRIAVTDAVQSVPGTGPDRASWQIAVRTTRNLLITAQNITDPGTGLPRDIGAPSSPDSTARAGPASAPARSSPRSAAGTSTPAASPARPGTSPASPRTSTLRTTSDTPAQIRDKPRRTLTTRHCG